ncbi:MAG: BadF/BadG/BcrA/BcrD ATPase family protein [Acidobacteriota bacterium]|nr:BadF/BadG/BcrA/BcrD ATPase family protein [Acidobacteriota bacterium]
MLHVTYFLGIDGGGSKTTCVLGDETNVIASLTVPGSNIVRVGERQARAALGQGIREVCETAGAKPEQIVAVCAGIAGAAREDIRQQVVAILAELVPGKVEVTGDMVIAHEAALGGAAGIVVLAGTGSIAYARHASGQTARAGGWGYAISDEGSGHWIGVQAVAAVAHGIDSGNITKLSDRILQRWQLSSYDQIVSAANASPAPDFSTLFPDVLAAAESGDPAAHDVLSRAGQELAKLPARVLRLLWKTSDAVNVALAGSVFQHSETVRDSFQRELKGSFPQCRVFLSQANAAEGALALARKSVAASI